MNKDVIVRAESSADLADLIRKLGSDFDCITLKAADGREVTFEKGSKFKTFMELLAR